MEVTMRELLQEWMKWVNMYGSLIEPTSQLEDLYIRTKEAVTKSDWSKYL